MDVAVLSFDSPMLPAMAARFAARGRSFKRVDVTKTASISAPVVIDCTALEIAQRLAYGDINHEALWKRCAEHGTIVILLSDGRVFDSVSGQRHLEEDAASAENDVSQTLLATEQALAASGADHLILRTSALFGDNQEGYLERLVAAVATGDRHSLDDTLKFAPTAFEDLARVLSGLIDQLLTGAEGRGVYHYQANDTITSFGFAEMIAAHLSQHRDIPGIKPDFVVGEDYCTLPMIPTLGCERILFEYGIKQLPWRRYLPDAIKSISASMMSNEKQREHV